MVSEISEPGSCNRSSSLAERVRRAWWGTRRGDPLRIWPVDWRFVRVL